MLFDFLGLSTYSADLAAWSRLLAPGPLPPASSPASSASGGPGIDPTG